MQIAIKISEHNKNVIDRFVNGEGFEVLPTPIVDDVIRAVRNGKKVVQTRGEKGALRQDKAIHTLFSSIPYLLCEQPYGEHGRYITYYAEERLYLVFDLWYHGFFLVEAGSPKEAIDEVNCDRLKYLPKGEGE